MFSSNFFPSKRVYNNSFYCFWFFFLFFFIFFSKGQSKGIRSVWTFSHQLLHLNFWHDLNLSSLIPLKLDFEKVISLWLCPYDLKSKPYRFFHSPVAFSSFICKPLCIVSFFSIIASFGFVPHIGELCSDIRSNPKVIIKGFFIGYSRIFCNDCQSFLGNCLFVGFLLLSQYSASIAISPTSYWFIFPLASGVDSECVRYKACIWSKFDFASLKEWHISFLIHLSDPRKFSQNSDSILITINPELCNDRFYEFLANNWAFLWVKMQTVE